MKKLTALFLALCLLLGLTACGANSSAPMADQAVRMEAAMEEPAAAEVNSSLTGNSDQGSTALPENRKWIITVNMDAETEDLDALLSGLDEEITVLGGFVEDQRIYNGSRYVNRMERNANLTIRIPAERVDAFTAQVGALSNVVRTEKNLEDITLTYVSTESRVTALETEEARLLELLAKAENMTDLLTIEERLTEVRYELENYASRLRLYDNQVEYATIYLSIEEVREYTPVAEKTVWERIRDGFSDSLEDLGDGLVDFFVWVVVNSPYLLLWGVILGAGLFLLLKLRRKQKAKEAKVQIPWQEAKPEDKKTE